MPWSSPMPLLRLDAPHAIAVCVAARSKKNLRNAASKSAGDATNCRSIDCGNGRLVPVCLGNERIFSQLLLRMFLAACHRCELQIKKPRGKCPQGLQYTIHPSVGRGMQNHTSDCECYNDLCVTHMTRLNAECPTVSGGWSGAPGKRATAVLIRILFVEPTRQLTGKSSISRRIVLLSKPNGVETTRGASLGTWS